MGLGQLQTAVETPQNHDEAMIERKRKWSALKDEEASFLKDLGDESDLDVDALVVLCNRLVNAAHTDLRGGYGIEK